MQIHTLQRTTPNRDKKRVGRGGTRGKTSGKGHKGQKARAGGTPRPATRDILKKIPKLRGHGKNRARTVDGSAVKPTAINLSVIDALFSKGDIVSPQTLKDKKVTSRVVKIKILGTGEISKSVVIESCAISDTAREKIEKAGGTVK